MAKSVVLGTPGYMSPESFDIDQKYDYKVDVWALGVTVFFMNFLKLPFWFQYPGV